MVIFHSYVSLPEGNNTFKKHQPGMVVNCLPPPPGSLHSFAAALRTSAKVEGFGPEGLEMPQLTKSKSFLFYRVNFNPLTKYTYVYIYIYVCVYIYALLYIYIEYPMVNFWLSTKQVIYFSDSGYFPKQQLERSTTHPVGWGW